MSENYYSILEIPETASSDEIKKSYRRLSMMYHPDKNKNNPDATAKFQKISEAYEVLGDADKRREYDDLKNIPFVKFGQRFNGNAGFNSNINPVDELFSQLFGMPFGASNFGQESPNFGQGNIRVFHNRGSVNHSLSKPMPIVKSVTIPIDKVLTGLSLPVDIERWIIQDGVKVFENETIYVPIPKGIDEGEMIILRDKGNVISENSKGDVKLTIKIENNTDFKRNGLDLIIEKSISLKEALCGFTFELKYITGKVYTINNTSKNVINHGYKKIIPNLGFTRDAHVGNLIIIFNVKFPTQLSDEIINQLKAIPF